MSIDFSNFNAIHTDLSLSGIVERKVLIISPMGSIDTYNSTQFSEAVSKTIENYPEVVHVVFNMGGVNYVSSTGIGSFTSLLKFCSDRKKEMHLWKVQEKVFDIFQLLGFTSFIHFIQELHEIDTGVAEKTVKPKIVTCPHCNKSIKIIKPGKFKCGTCKGIVIVNDNMEITSE